MKVEPTERGFARIDFIDRYDVECSLQKSSLAFEDAIWLGVNEPDPQIMSSKVRPGGTGWESYPLPEDVHCNTRMHLTQEQVAELLPHLQRFVETGEI